MNKEKSELDPKQVFNFVGYQFDLREGKVRPTPERWQTLTDKILSILSGPVCPVRKFMSLIGLLTATEKQVHLGRLHMRPIQWHVKNNWRVPESLEKVIPVPRSLHPHLKWWLKLSSVLTGQPLTCSANLYRCIKRRVGCSLKRVHCKGNLVSSRKQVAHKSPGAKSGLSGLKRVPRPLFKQHSPGSHRQHNSGCLYQQRRGGEVGLPVCPTVENPVLVHQETGNSQGTSHPRPAESDSRQAIQTWRDHSDRMVPSPRGVQSYMLLVAPATSGPVCHQVQQQTTSLCHRFWTPGMGSGCTQPIMGKSGPICLPTSSHLGQSGGEVAGLPMQQNHSDCSRVAQHALVLGSSGNVQSDPSVSAQPAQSGISSIQPDLAQELVKPEPTCLSPRATAIKEQGFSEAVAARNCDLLPLGSLFLMGLNSTLSSYSQSRSEKKGGGGGVNLGLPVNRLVLADLDLSGHRTLGQNGPYQFCSFMSSCMSLAAYLPSKR